MAGASLRIQLSQHQRARSLGLVSLHILPRFSPLFPDQILPNEDQGYRLCDRHNCCNPSNSGRGYELLLVRHTLGYGWNSFTKESNDE